MASLTSTERDDLPPSKFAIPPSNGNPGKYPIHDRSHAANALARVKQAGSPSEQSQVVQAVCKLYPDFPECQKPGSGVADRIMGSS